MTLFMYDNYVNNSTFIYASTAKTGFPSTNLKNPFRTKRWVVSNGTGTVVFAGSTKTEINTICLAGFDWTSQPSTIKLEMNATTDFSSPTTTCDLTSLYTANPSTYGNQTIIVKKLTTEQYKCYKLKVGHGSSWAVGLVYIGPSFQPTNDRLVDGDSEEMVDPSLIATAVDGQEHIDELTQYRTRKFTFLSQTSGQWQRFQTMWNNVGIRKDLFVRFSSVAADYTWYGKFTKSPKISFTPPSYHKIGFQFKESR